MIIFLAVLCLQPGIPEVPGSWELGVYAVDIVTGDEIMSVNGRVPFRPASTVKAVTTLAALEYLGSDFIYSTVIEADTAASRVILRGAGAPLLSAEDVTRTAMETAAWLQPGSTWDLYLDISSTEGEPHLQGWDEDDWNRTYCPPVEPLCIGDNVLEIIVSAAGNPVRVYTYPPLPSLVLNASGLAAGGSTALTVTGGNWDTGSPELTISGTIRSGTREIVYKPFAGAPVELVLYLQNELRSLGVETAYMGFIQDEAGQADRVVTSVMYSDPLWMILGSMNKWSRNMVAEQVLRTTASEVTGLPGSTRSGCDISGALLESICPDVTGWQLADGSGLSRLNMLAPIQLASVFRTGASSLEYGPEFLACFPINGTDGTLASRIEGIPTGAFRGKTGSLNDTCTIAGILTTASGREVALAVFLHIPRGHIWRARAWQDAFIEDLYRDL